MLKNIYDKLVEIECSLDDAYISLPEWNGNSDSRSYVDSARNELYELKDEVEKALIDGADVSVKYDELDLESLGDA